MKPYPQHYEASFSRLFGVSLRRFWHPIFGFNIVDFDSLMQGRGYVEDGKTSLKDFISKKHGEAGVAVVESLIGK